MSIEMTFLFSVESFYSNTLLSKQPIVSLNRIEKDLKIRKMLARRKAKKIDSEEWRNFIIKY